MSRAGHADAMTALRRAHTWFQRYARRFAGDDGKLPPMQQLKLDHCRRVAGAAREISVRLSWPDADVLLAETAGLLHDVGRFSQFQRYRTFVDAESVDHGAHGREILGTAGVLAGCPPAARRLVETAVGHHNCRELPVGLAADQRRLLQLVRDADKLDIFEVSDDAIRHERLGLYPEIVLRVDIDGAPSDCVLTALRRRQSVPYGAIASLADFLLVQLNWVHGIRYTATLELMLERDVIGRLSEHLPDTVEVRAAVAAVHAAVAERIAAVGQSG